MPVSYLAPSHFTEAERDRGQDRLFIVQRVLVSENIKLKMTNSTFNPFFFFFYFCLLLCVLTEKG